MQPSVARECWKCRGETRGSLACPCCGAVQSVTAGTDLFAVLGLPRSLAIDPTDLEERYHAASRSVHPDRHQTATERERELSLAASAAVNRAYRTLREPVARGWYWLELHDARPEKRGQQVPAALAAEVFAAQEKLEELRAEPGRDGLRAEVAVLRDDLAARLNGLREELVAAYGRWRNDGATVLGELARRLAEIAYLNTLLGDIEETIEGEPRGTDRRH